MATLVKPLPPWPSEGVGDDDGDLFACGIGDLRLQPARGCIGGGGEQREPAFGDVGGIHSGVGAGEAMMGLGHDRSRVHAHDALALPQDHFQMPGVLVHRRGQRKRKSGRLNAAQLHHPALGLGNNLLRQYQHVTIVKAQTAMRHGPAQLGNGKSGREGGT